MRTQFSRVDEFYRAIDTLIERLREDHFDDEAARLHALRHETAWTTGSELMGELALALKNMKDHYPRDVQAAIADCLHFARHHRTLLGMG